ncbi:hypothetical protein [Dankookia sp. P2]|uniref:hypothetical protein n=1 Tax=Dankookia sp. P2 TaxID=3423955 RepID=UPI003D664D97
MAFLAGISIRDHQKAVGATKRLCSGARGAGQALAAPGSASNRGGYGTKARVIANSAGRTVALASGQAQELPHAVPLLEHLPKMSIWVAADRSYSDHAFQYLWELDAPSAIPLRTGEAPIACSAAF